MLVASFGDEARVLARVLPCVFSVRSVERLASVEVLPIPLFNRPTVYFVLNIFIFVIGDSIFF